VKVYQVTGGTVSHHLSSDSKKSYSFGSRLGMMLLLGAVLLLFSICLASEPPAHQCCRLLSPGLRGLNYASLNRKKRSLTTVLRELFGIKRSAAPYLELDFNAKYSYIDMEHEVKIYRPELFAKLRERIGISDEYYFNCLNANNLQCLSSDSKSGQAFWMSNDGSIVLKTLKHYELCNLRNILGTPFLLLNVTIYSLI